MTNPQTPAEIRLPNRWLPLAWKIWLIYALLMLSLLLAGLPLLMEASATPCDGDDCRSYRVTSAQAARLEQAGISLTTHAFIRTTFVLILDSTFAYALAFLLFWRKRDDWIALIFAIPIVSHAANYPGALPLMEAAHPALLPLTRLPNLAIMVFWYLFFCTFPDGRFVPRWGRWLVFISVGVGLLTFDPNGYQAGNLSGIIAGQVWFPLSFVFGLGFQTYRYQRFSTPAQQKQARWFIYTLAVSLAASLIVFPVLRLLVPTLADANSPARLYFDQIAGSFFGPIVVLLGFWIAIVRHKMFDVDILIRRTLQYSVLSGLLGLTYFGLVIVLQNLTSAVGGQRSEFVTVASTLAIAALFFPLCNRVQEFIDKRFYRKKYDAQKVLAEFAATCRDETDLDKLTARLAEVIDETLQPEKVSVWIKPTADSGRPTAEPARPIPPNK